MASNTELKSGNTTEVIEGISDCNHLNIQIDKTQAKQLFTREELLSETVFSNILTDTTKTVREDSLAIKTAASNRNYTPHQQLLDDGSPNPLQERLDGGQFFPHQENADG